MTEQFRPRGFSFLPPVVKNLLIINVIMFLATVVLERVHGIDLNDWLGLYFFQSKGFHAYQFISYMFMHGSFSHLLFNMFALWMFGHTIENIWGAKRFLIFYFATGIGAGLVQELVCGIRIFSMMNELSPEMVNIVRNDGLELLREYKNYTNSAMADYNRLLNSVTVGASGAVYGILLAFGMMFPNALIYIYFLFPIKAKWFVVIYGAIELVSGVASTGDGIAHFARLGGMIFGFVLIRHWQKNSFTR